MCLTLSTVVSHFLEEGEGFIELPVYLLMFVKSLYVTRQN